MKKIFSISVHNSKLSEKENNPFTLAPKTIKYLGINLIKEVKYIPTLKTTKHWQKKSKKAQIIGKVSYVHGLEELILLKCPHYMKLSIDSMHLSNF